MKTLGIKLILLILHTFLFSQNYIITNHIKTPNNTSVENTVYFNSVEDVESLAQNIVELIDF